MIVKEKIGIGLCCEGNLGKETCQMKIHQLGCGFNCSLKAYGLHTFITPSLHFDTSPHIWVYYLHTMASILPISSPSSSLSTRPHLLSRNFNDNGRRRTVVVRAEGGSSGEHINPAIRKSEDKVVDSVLVPELSKPLTPYCRFFWSHSFPFIPHSHMLNFAKWEEL